MIKIKIGLISLTRTKVENVNNASLSERVQFIWYEIQINKESKNLNFDEKLEIFNSKLKEEDPSAVAEWDDYNNIRVSYKGIETTIIMNQNEVESGN